MRLYLYCISWSIVGDVVPYASESDVRERFVIAVQLGSGPDSGLR